MISAEVVKPDLLERSEHVQFRLHSQCYFVTFWSQATGASSPGEEWTVEGEWLLTDDDPPLISKCEQTGSLLIDRRVNRLNPQTTRPCKSVNWFSTGLKKLPTVSKLLQFTTKLASSHRTSEPHDMWSLSPCQLSLAEVSLLVDGIYS